MELGHYLRKRYKGFLNETYRRNEVLQMISLSIVVSVSRPGPAGLLLFC